MAEHTRGSQIFLIYLCLCLLLLSSSVHLAMSMDLDGYDDFDVSFADGSFSDEVAPADDYDNIDESFADDSFSDEVAPARRLYDTSFNVLNSSS